MAYVDVASVSSLGSSLLAADAQSEVANPALLCIGCESIDDVLGGGLTYTTITSIASIASSLRSLLAFHLIASHLIAQPETDVVFVDACGTFSAKMLRDIMAAKLGEPTATPSFQHAGYMYQPSVEHAAIPEEHVEQATGMLDRVRLARVFDITGLVEMIGEATKACRAAQSPENVSASNDPNAEQTAQHVDGDTETRQTDVSAVGLFVVDDLASLLAPLITSNQTEAQSLLASIHRSLGHLVKNHRVCAILLNGVVGNGKAPQENPTASTNRASEVTSLLQSVKGKPALGQMFAGLVDVSIMLSSIPRSKGDAEVIYAGSSTEKVPKVRYVNVLEVLKDRHGLRQDCVAAFEILDAQTLVAYKG